MRTPRDAKDFKDSSKKIFISNSRPNVTPLHFEPTINTPTPNPTDNV
jgi:hypothetical protein